MQARQKVGKKERPRNGRRERQTRAVCTPGVNAICSTVKEMETFIREVSCCLCLAALWLSDRSRSFVFPLFLFPSPLVRQLRLPQSGLLTSDPCAVSRPLFIVSLIPHHGYSDRVIIHGAQTKLAKSSRIQWASKETKRRYSITDSVNTGKQQSSAGFYSRCLAGSQVRCEVDTRGIVETVIAKEVIYVTFVT